MQRREKEAQRREAAAEWLRSAIAIRGGQPVEATGALAQAEANGHRPEDVEAVAVRVRRRSKHDDAEYLTLPGRYLRRDWLPVE